MEGREVRFSHSMTKLQAAEVGNEARLSIAVDVCGVRVDASRRYCTIHASFHAWLPSMIRQSRGDSKQEMKHSEPLHTFILQELHIVTADAGSTTGIKTEREPPVALHDHSNLRIFLS